MLNKLDVEIHEKLYKKLLIIGVVVMVVYIVINVMALAIPRIYIVDKNTVLDTEGSVKNGINILHRGKMCLELSGWAYKEGQAVSTFKSCFLLKSQETEKMYLMQTEMKQVPELQVVDGTYDCLNCGIYTQSIVLGLKDGNYDLYILYQNDGENLLVDTGVVVEI